MSTSVFCTATESQTDAIVRKLKTAGFSNNDISVLMADKSGTKDFAYEHNTKAPEGTATGAGTGAGTGAVLGGTLGWLAGIGALAIPGLGPFIAAGPIMAALGGAAVGGLTGALIGMGIPDFEAKKYEGKVKSGSSLISVHSDDSDETERAKEIFEEGGAEDITTAGEVAVPAGSRA